MVEEEATLDACMSRYPRCVCVDARIRVCHGEIGVHGLEGVARVIAVRRSDRRSVVGWAYSAVVKRASCAGSARRSACARLTYADA